MTPYEQKALYEVVAWKRKVNQRSNLFQRLSKKAQTKINSLIPVQVHHFITESIRKLVQVTLFGSEYTTKAKDVGQLTLEEREHQVARTLEVYTRTAIIEGASTGAAGLLIGLADFPLLLTIKMKFLFEVASIYGFDVKQYEERLFILHVFQLAFSSDEHQRDLLHTMEQWDAHKDELQAVDWQKLQQEYRDYIDLTKMLQLVPGIGAIVGAYANNKLLQHLGETAMNAYRLRLFNLEGK
ncbi:MAG TPA: EcsC family protein [Bacillota bacterium]|nr:EcsC family protein [Bacillota bacterium]